MPTAVATVAHQNIFEVLNQVATVSPANNVAQTRSIVLPGKVKLNPQPAVYVRDSNSDPVSSNAQPPSPCIV